MKGLGPKAEIFELVEILLGVASLPPHTTEYPSKCKLKNITQLPFYQKNGHEHQRWMEKTENITQLPKL